MMLTPAAAVAGTIFVYNLTSDASHAVAANPALSGRITFHGNNGDSAPELGTAGVTSFQFTLDGNTTWNNTNSTFPTDDMGFNGTLGSSTLNGTSGFWQIDAASVTNVDLYLFRPATAWSIVSLGRVHSSNRNEICGDFGFSWSLTLASATNDTPEPGTAGLVPGALAALRVTRRVSSSR